MKDSIDLKGVTTALITPFNKGKVDWASFEKLLNFQIEQDLDGFVVNGTTAESPTLHLDEVEKLIKVTKSKIESSGRHRNLIVGTGSNSTEKTIELTKKAEAWGADAALVVTPYYNKPPQRGLVKHFRQVAESVKIPVVLYNVPGRTITNMSTATMVELSKVDNIIGIKEATGDMKFGDEVVKALPQDFVVTSGDDGTFLQLAALGGKGVIGVCSHIIGKQMRELLHRLWEGDKSAITDYDKYKDFISQLYTEANPIPIKMALYLLGVIESPELRSPLVELEASYTESLKVSMQKAGLLNV